MTIVVHLDPTPYSALNLVLRLVLMILVSMIAVLMILVLVLATIAYSFKKENKKIVRNSPGLCDDPSLCVLYKDIEEQCQCTPLEKRKRKDKATVSWPGHRPNLHH
jgi:hypothetical protein